MLEMLCQITFMIVRTNGQISIPATGAVLRGNCSSYQFGKQEDHLALSNATHQTKKKNTRESRHCLQSLGSLFLQRCRVMGCSCGFPARYLLPLLSCLSSKHPQSSIPRSFLAWSPLLHHQKKNKTKLNKTKLNY